jgi:uncharacterized protein
MIERTAIWQPWHGVGLEHLRLVEGNNGAIADSLIIWVVDSQSIRLRYEIRVDAVWRVREANIDMWLPTYRQLKLRSNGCGRWTDAAGQPVDRLDGCVDIDLTVTPFTNTLPIRRIRLEQGESEEISVAYIEVPELSVRLARQRYTYLGMRGDGGLYRYEGLENGFKTELQVDASGIVLDYPGIWRRLPLEH